MEKRDDLKILSLEKIYRGELAGDSDIEMTDEEWATVVERAISVFIQRVTEALEQLTHARTEAIKALDRFKENERRADQ